MAGLLVVLVFVQAGLGAWVSSNYATLACQDFPRCQGQWWPPMDLRSGFQWWRPLGQTADGQMLPFAALTAIHYVHRLAAYVVLAVVAWVAWRARRHLATRALGNAMIAVAALQLATGLTNVFLQWPAPAAVLHTGGAAVLFGSALMLRWRARAGPHARMVATADSGLLGPGSELSVTR
jgi:cytochrome c oxidase assembly protein subunit 15